MYIKYRGLGKETKGYRTKIENGGVNKWPGDGSMLGGGWGWGGGRAKKRG